MMPLDGLEALVPGTQLQAPTAGVTTFRVGGPAGAICRVRDVSELKAVLRFLAQRGCPYRVLGKGSNLLFADEGYAGVLLLLGEGFSYLNIGQDGLFSVGAGMSLARMANTIARAGLGGLEFSAQIPGCVGGSVAVNAGAFKQDLHSRLVTVKAVDGAGNEVELPSRELAGCYRTTVLKGHQDLVLVEATFQAELKDPAEVLARQKEYGAYREKTQPINLPSAGCVFKNPAEKGCSAGALIDRLGMKGFAIGDACVSEKHANFIVNRGKALARDVVDLIERIRGRVSAETGITLEPEIEFVGIALAA